MASSTTSSASTSKSASKKAAKKPTKRQSGGDEPTEEQAVRRRYRVTGGVFLAAVALIVLPMLFDPAAPSDVDLPSVSMPTDLPVLDEPPPLLHDDGFIAEAEAQEARVDEDGYDRQTGGRIGEPFLLEEGEVEARQAAGTTTDDRPANAQPLWAVQVAAFADRANARAFRDQLKKDGFAAFTTSVKRSGEILHRVAVGPLVSRSDAESERQTLAKQYELDAIIVGFEA